MKELTSCERGFVGGGSCYWAIGAGGVGAVLVGWIMTAAGYCRAHGAGSGWAISGSEGSYFAQQVTYGAKGNIEGCKVIGPLVLLLGALAVVGGAIGGFAVDIPNAGNCDKTQYP